MSRGTGARAKRLSRKRGLGDIGESVKEQLDDQEEDFKASFQPEKGGTCGRPLCNYPEPAAKTIKTRTPVYSDPATNTRTPVYSGLAEHLCNICSHSKNMNPFVVCFKAS